MIPAAQATSTFALAFDRCNHALEQLITANNSVGEDAEREQDAACTNWCERLDDAFGSQPIGVAEAVSMLTLAIESDDLFTMWASDQLEDDPDALLRFLKCLRDAIAQDASTQ